MAKSTATRWSTCASGSTANAGASPWWAGNLLDEEILSFSANVPFASSVGANTHYSVPLRPQVFGVQGSLRF